MIRPKPHLKDIYRTPHDRFDRNDYLRLDKNEGFCDISGKVLRTACSKITPDFLSTYPQMDPLYVALSAYLRLPEDHIYITAGSDAAIKSAFETFVEPDDGVIIPDPTYAMYEVYASLFRADLKKIIYDEDLRLSVDDMISAIGKNTRLIALPNPDSPTGSFIDRRQIERLIRAANGEDITVIIDEAYYLFTDQTVIDLVEKYDNLIVTRTFSKAFGLASIRLGYAVACPEMISWLRRFKPMYEVNAFAVLMGCAALDNIEQIHKSVKEINIGKQYLEEEMQRLGIKTYPSYSNFLNIEIGESRIQPLVDTARDAGILIKGGYAHPTLKNCIRVGAGPKKVMKKIVPIIKKIFIK